MRNIYYCLYFTIGTILFGLAGNRLHAQEVAMFSQSIRSQEIMNPAFNADKDYISAILLYRNQWFGIDANPRTMGVNIRYPVYFNAEKSLNGLGIALNVAGEMLGLRNVVDAGINVDALVQLGQESYMGVGINIGLEFYQYDLNRLIAIEDDNVINKLTLKGVLPNVGVGLLFTHKNYRFGLSSFTLVKDDLTDNYRFVPGFDVYAGADYQLSESVVLTPQVLVKNYVQFSTSIDISLTTTLNDRLGLGIGYRYNESVFALMQLRIADLFWLSYSYDYPIKGISTFGNGSHEISISFGMNKHHDHTKGNRKNKFR